MRQKVNKIVGEYPYLKDIREERLLWDCSPLNSGVPLKDKAAHVIAAAWSKMTTLAEFMIVAGAENRPPMLDKAMYNSWESRMLLYIKAKKNGRMMLESIENGPLVYPTIEVDGQIPKKKYTELTE
ncbi:hypothetical protein Tco_0583337 [Tanacetum coccineum]